VLELVEWCIVVFVDHTEVLFKTFKFVFILDVDLHYTLQFRFQLAQVSSPSFNIFLSFKQKDLLLFIMGFHRFSQSIFPVFQHFNQHL